MLKRDRIIELLADIEERALHHERVVGDPDMVVACRALYEGVRRKYNEQAKVPIPKDGHKTSTGRLYINAFYPPTRKAQDV